MRGLKTNEKNGNPYLRVIIIFALCFFSFLHAGTGFDFADEGYGFYNFETFPNFDSTWAIATLYANIIGKVFTLLPLGHTVLGLRIYCSILFFAFVIWEYRELSKYYSDMVVFVGLLISIGLCWAPKGLLYHYISYYLFNMAALLVVRALNTGKHIWLVLAGFLLGSNVFVRFPNIVECALILVVWLYGLLERKNVIKESLLCIAGYAVAIAVGVLVITMIWNHSAFYEMVISLFKMGRHVNEYSPFAYALSMFYAYKLRVEFWLPYISLAVVSALFHKIIKEKKIIWHWGLIVGDLLAFVLLTALMLSKKLFSFSYGKYLSFENWATLFLVLAIFFLVKTLFSKTVKTQDRIIVVSALLILLITPIGGNNFIFENYNNLFLIAPVSLAIIYKSVFEGKNAGQCASPCEQVRNLSGHFVCLLIVAAFLVQSIGFGLSFIYRDEDFFKTDYVSIERNDALQGMKISDNKVMMVNGLTSFLENNNYGNKKAIIWGNYPGLFYTCSLDNALSHGWIYLYSYLDSYLEKDLSAVSENCDDKDYPLFIYERGTEFENAISVDEMEDNKVRLLALFLVENGYKEVYRDEFIGVMVKNK